MQADGLLENRQVNFELQTAGNAWRTNIVDTWPHRPQHHQHTISTYAGLYTIPLFAEESFNVSKSTCITVYRTRYYGRVRSSWVMTGDAETHQAMAPLLKVHHKEPHSPKLVRATTGKVMWKIAPGLALRTIKGATHP